MATSEPKYHAIKKQLAREIAEGVYDDGARLPTCRELAKIHDASYLTVNKAVRLLQEEGYAKLIQGKGTFAVSRKKRRKTKKVLDSQRVGFLMPVKGDLFQNFFSRMLAKLGPEGLLAVPFDEAHNEDALPQWQIRSELDAITSQPMRSFVIDGSRHFPFRLLREFHDRVRQTNFIFYFDSAIDFPGANFILSDFRRGGQLAASHLLDHGRRHIALITFEQLPENVLARRGASVRQYDAELCDGIKDAFDSHAIDHTVRFSVIHQTLSASEPKEYDIENFIQAGGDGFICLGDSRALPIYRAAAKHGLRIGADLGVVGYYNTPWCEVFNPPLSSVSIREEKIADLAAQAVLKNWKGKKFSVPSRLVERSSA